MVGMANPHTELRNYASRPSFRSTRIGDRERADTCDALSAHFAAGRMSSEELDERLAAAVGASTEAELRWVLADLPPLGNEASWVVPPPAAARPQPPNASWRASDILVLLLMLGCVAVAGIAVLALFAGGFGSWPFIIAGTLSALVAGTGGAAAVHLVHRAVARQWVRTASELHQR